jgi:hypothetical protein
MEKQLRFDLGDRHQYLDAILEGKRLNDSQSWQIYFSVWNKKFWLGIRTAGPVETEHDFVEDLSANDAEFLVTQRHIRVRPGVKELLDALKKDDLLSKAFYSKAA